MAFRGRIEGWVWDADNPEARLTVVIRDAKTILAEAEASKFRPDLLDGGIGDGRYGFDVTVPSTSDHGPISVEVKGIGYELPMLEGASNPAWANPDNLPDTQINVLNFGQIRTQPPANHFYIRLDTNFDCNLHCVYCHNPRSKDLLDLVELRDYLEHRVTSVENFQIGCAMEPTIDSRLTDFMLMIADTPARPKNIFQLQTNGTLLHRHNYRNMIAAGLTSLSVSLDSAEPETQKLLRSGTSLKKVLRNVADFRSACPDISVQFISTVTSANVHRLGEVVRLGIDLGVSNFAFRELFYISDNSIVDHTRMPGLLLKSGEFASAQAELRSAFPEAVMEFFDTGALFGAERKIKSDSFL